MKYALERIYKLVNSITVEQDESRNEEHWTESIHASNKEREAIKQYLLRRSLNISSEKEFELLIQQYQAEIIGLLDTVYEFKTSYRYRLDVCDVVIKVLQDVLTHIENRYGKYFNQDERVPMMYLNISFEEVERRVKLLRTGLNKKADLRLTKIVLDAFERSKVKQYTYKQLMYLKDLLNELEEMKSSDTSVLIMQLVYMNFNSGVMTSFVISEIVDDINAIHEAPAKTERLLHLQKEYSQMPVKPSVAFKPSSWSLKDQVVTWIDEELKYLKEKQRLISVVPAIQEALVTADEEKLHFSVSVEVLSMFIRAGMDTQLILNKQKTPMLKLLSKYMRTVEQENISYKSMRNNWYNVNKAQKEKVKDILMEMYKAVHKY